MNEDTAQEGHTLEVYGDRRTCMQQIRFHLHPSGKAVWPRDFPKMHHFRDPSTYHMVLWVCMFYSEVRKENCWNSWCCNMLIEQNGTFFRICIGNGKCGDSNDQTPQLFCHEVLAEQTDEAKFRRNYRLRMWNVKQWRCRTIISLELRDVMVQWQA